jgi:hypothetical protein
MMLTVALLSVSLVALELAWTRLFSAEFFYTFAFLVLSLAILGLGLGALSLRLWPRLARPERLPLYLSLAALCALAGPPLVFLYDLDFPSLFSSPAMVGKLVLTIFTLNAPYFFGGMALALLFRAGHQRLDRLYTADLLGAGAGVAGVVVLMNAIGTPTATFYCALPLLLAALLTARRAWKLAPVALAAVMVVLGTQAPSLLEREREEHAPIVYKHWDAAAKIKIFGYEEPWRRINVDNAANSPVYEFDGNWDRPDSLRFQFGIDVEYLIDQFDECTFLSLGSGGGGDVLQALQYGATEAHAVEVVPHVNWLMTEGMLHEYTGRLYDDPRVVVATEDARAYVRRHPQTFDVIYSLSSNTFAALASGAFAMAENYLFTTEAFGDYWRALSDGGFMMMEHQFYMPRLVSEVIEALEAEGVAEPRQHFAIYNLPSMRRKMVLLSKRPLTDEIRNLAFVELTPELEEHIHLLYPPRDGDEDNLINRIVQEGWRQVAAEAPIDVSPSTDDRPYAAQLGLWRNFAWDRLEKVHPLEEVLRGFPLSKLLIVIILIVVVALVVPLNLIPYAVSREKLGAAPWLYFFLIGAAFMMVEVVLIQKYALFIGPSVMSLATILLALLWGSGIGSRLSRRVPDVVAFAGIIGWLALEVVVFPQLTTALAGLPMAARMAVTALLIAPLGFFMGMPFPKAGLRVGELIDWGFAVNGAASVLGGTLVVLVAFSWGFRAALAIAAGVYLIAGMLLAIGPAWRVARGEELENEETAAEQPPVVVEEPALRS